ALALALRDKDSTVRFAASESLQHFDQHAAPVLVEALEHENADVRRRAAGALEGSESAVAALGKVLLKDKDAGVRQTAARVLGGCCRAGCSCCWASGRTGPGQPSGVSRP